MLEITLPASEYYDESTTRLFTIPETTLRLEHSLLSISKWEAKYKRSFMSKGPETNDEVMYYVQCMDLDGVLEPYMLAAFTDKQFQQIQEYLADPQTATTIHEMKRRRASKVTVTSEVIYYWMFVRGIPIDCERWPINRLLMLIRVFDVENGSGDKRNRMTAAESADWRRAENERRRAKLKTKG